MPAYDNYDEIDELLSSWAPLFGTIKTRKMRRPASRPGEPPAFCVVKSFILDDEPTLSAIEEQSEVFAAWDAQKRAASSKGAQHIAPILRLERAGEREIWQERGWYSASLQDLVRGDIPLKHEELLHVARSIVAGLRELRDGADGRSHGRLELANVVVGTGEPIDELDLAQAPVFLTDPLPVDLKHTFQTEQADLKALGEIIGQLAERNTTFFFKSAAIMASDKWLELGKHSQRWEEICKRLLEGKSAPTEKSALDELANELDEWARPGVRDKLRVLANRAG